MEQGALVASGRDGDIFEFGDGLVLRKTRDGRSIEHEACVMRYAAEQGYPVPEVHDVRANGSEIIMERIGGPLMMAPMAKRPWTIPRYASRLADLHDQLHEIPRLIGSASHLMVATDSCIWISIRSMCCCRFADRS